MTPLDMVAEKPESVERKADPQIRTRLWTTRQIFSNGSAGFPIRN